MDFPSIDNPDYPLKEEAENSSLYSRFENGSVQARRKFTKSRKTYTLTWNALPDDQYQKLDEFVREEARFSANEFNWTHPVTGKKIVCYISGEDTPYEASYSNFNQWAVTLKITEK